MPLHEPSGDTAAQKPASTAQPELPLAIIKHHIPSATSTNTATVLRILRKIRWLPLLPVMMLTGGVIAMYFQPPGIRVAMRALGLQPGGGTKYPIAIPAPKLQEAARSSMPSSRQIVALAKLVPEGELRTVAPPFGAGDARIATLRVEEGEKVQSGDVLAILDNEGQLKSAVESTQASVAQRTAALEQTRAQVRASREEAEAALARAQATARNAQADFERIDQLAKRGVSSEAALGKSRTARDETAREVDRLRATLSRFQSVDIDKQPDIVVAAGNLAVAKSEFARATQDLDKAFVRAPIAGTILTILVRPGEKPGAAGILKLGNLERMQVEIEVFQTQIGYVALGDSVVVTADSLPKGLEATVVKIGLEVGRQTLVDSNPAANTDARVVKVQAALTPSSSHIAQRFTNLQAIARITTQVRP